MTPTMGQNSPPTAQNEHGEISPGSEDDLDWLRLATDAYLSSTTYVDSNYRKMWDDSIRAFNNMHAADSKYNNPAYDKRSKLFRPKMRAIIRKNEAAAAAAFFSSKDVTSVTATDATSKVQVAGAEIMKNILQHRLTKTIPWFKILLGGLQDAQTVGSVCAHIYWDYKEGRTPVAAAVKAEPVESGENEYPKQDKIPDNAFVAEGDPPPEQAVQVEAMVVEKVKPITDKPVISLVPIENLRIDPAADWTDPINSSPFVIHMMPMYLMDIRARMKTGEWKKYSDGAVKAWSETKYDSTRSARLQREDVYTSDNKEYSGYEICWVQRHIHRKGDQDWEFYTLGTTALLSTPRLLEETVLHGKRPYVLGTCVLEAHKSYSTSLPQLGKDLTLEANEVANQRIDNVKFVLNKKFLVKRGKEADLAGLLRNVPGGVVMLDDPQNDVKEMSWPDVTASAYEEQSRIDNDMNDLLGNFSAGQVMADHGINGPARNMAILGQSAGTLVEYLLRTFTETFVEPVLRQLMLLEQHYETDQTLLAIAAKQANLAQRFGVDKVTDELLEQELTLTVNVGMGATDPQMKLQKFTAAMQSFIMMSKEAPPTINLQEVGKEIFGHMGYQDGTRFLTSDNPQVIQLEAKLKQAMGIIQQLELKVQDKMTAHQVKIAATKIQAENKLVIAEKHEEAENLRTATTHLRALRETDRGMAHEVAMRQLEHGQLAQRAQQSAQTQMTLGDAKNGK
jgi:hypothetical protein